MAVPATPVFDSQTTCRRLEGKYGSAGQAPDVCRAASRVDERLDILNFALDRVGLRIATVAPASPVVVEDGEVLCQQLG